MIKTAWLLLVFFIPSMTMIAQQKPLPINVEIEKILTQVKEFNKSESKLDSMAGHPLGSNKEEDFAAL